MFAANYFGGPYFAQAYLLIVTSDGVVGKIFLIGSFVPTIELSGSVIIMVLAGSLTPPILISGSVENYED